MVRIRKEKTIDLLVVSLLVILAALITLATNINFLTSTLLFFGAPSLYLAGRNLAHVKKAAVAGGVFGIVWGYSFNFIAEANNAWDWTPNSGGVLPFNFFGEVSGDVLVWYFLWVFFAVLFYEYFIDRSKRKISKRTLPITVTGFVVAVAVSLAHILAPESLMIPYAYLWLGVLALVPFAYVVWKDPRLFSKSLRMLPFFLGMYFLCELTSVYQGLWSFPGQYIGTIIFVGVVFPIEEFFFWIVSSSVVAVAYYEYAIDDEK